MKPKKKKKNKKHPPKNKPKTLILFKRELKI